MTPLRTIILAAGKGIRMNSDTPKVLHCVCGKPMIQYVIEVIKSVGSLKNYVVLGYQFEQVRPVLDQSCIIILQKKMLGTADAIASAASPFKSYRGDILVLCGDSPLLTTETILNLVKKHKTSKASATILTSTVKDPQRYGRIIRNDQGEVMAVREQKDATPLEKQIEEINTGVYCFQSEALFKTVKSIRMNEKKKEFYLTDIIGLLVQKGFKVESVETPDFWVGLGINTREDLALAESVMRQRILKNFMIHGVTIEDPATTYIAYNVKIGHDTVIRPATVIENDVSIGSRCQIGPFCRLRPGTRIADDVEIGNFTEVSRSQVGKSSLMKHFSFLGDAVVGSKVNIGAGVVTANFDGKTKNRTIISDQAFIGSDSILVAPVKVGKRAMTGAGSVVTKGKVIPDGKIAVGVPARILRRKQA